MDIGERTQADRVDTRRWRRAHPNWPSNKLAAVRRSCCSTRGCCSLACC